MKSKTKSPNETKFVALGASLTGLAATAYFLLGPNGQKNQNNFKVWAIKMKSDILEKLEASKNVSEPIYHQIIDTIATKHEKANKAKPVEIKTLAKDLKKHWSTISQSTSAIKQKTTKASSKAGDKKVATKNKKNLLVLSKS